MPHVSNHGAVHVFVLGGGSMRRIPIRVSSSRVFNSRCGGGKLRSGTVSQANTFTSVSQCEKVRPGTDVSFARQYSLGPCWRISRRLRSCRGCGMACAGRAGAKAGKMAFAIQTQLSRSWSRATAKDVTSMSWAGRCKSEPQRQPTVPAVEARPTPILCRGRDACLGTSPTSKAPPYRGACLETDRSLLSTDLKLKTAFFLLLVLLQLLQLGLQIRSDQMGRGATAASL
jgi:hypothetical protein